MPENGGMETAGRAGREGRGQGQERQLLWGALHWADDGGAAGYIYQVQQIGFSSNCLNGTVGCWYALQ